MGRLIDADDLKEKFEACMYKGDAIQSIINEQYTVEAIPKADYENRLKADMVAMLEDLFLDVKEAELAGMRGNKELIFSDEIEDIIQQKINSLKENE